MSIDAYHRYIFSPKIITRTISNINEKFNYTLLPKNAGN